MCYGRIKKVSIHLRDQTSGKAEEVVADFTDDEILILEGYILNLERLKKTKLLSNGMPSGLKLHFDSEKSLSFNVCLPDEDQILSFLHRMRRFILNDETSSYNKVTGIIGRRFNNTIIRSMIKHQREIYDGRHFQNLIQIQSNGEIINSEKILFNWLNAFEYHDDSTKRQEIDKLHQLMPLEASRAIFLMLLTEKVKAIYSIADFVSLILGKIENIETKI